MPFINKYADHMYVPRLLACALIAVLANPNSVSAQLVATVREQTPVPPFPYAVHEVTVTSHVSLSCVVTEPLGDQPRSGAVLLTVAGPNDRDQTHSGHKPFMVLADHLTRSGIAVLRCDDRGVGASKGDVTAATLADLTADASAMVNFMRSRDRIGSVGVIGNSEGSVVGAAVTRNAGNADFLVMLGGVGVTGAEVIRFRQEAMGKANGLDGPTLVRALAPFDSIAAWVRTVGGIGIEAARSTHKTIVDSALALIRSGRLPRDPMLPQDAEAQLTLFLGPWYYAQVTLDAKAILSKVTAPTLALTGTLDRVNLPEQNLPAIKKALVDNGNTDVTTILVPGVNHVFQTARTGMMIEYGYLSETFSVQVMKTIAKWILERFASR